METADREGLQRAGSSRPSTLMIDIPGDLVWDLPCVQQASYLEGGPLEWMLPLHLHFNQKSDYDDILWLNVWECIFILKLFHFHAFVFYYLNFTALSRIFYLYTANRSSNLRDNQKTHGKNHLTIHKQNLASPHVTRTTALRNLMD